MEKTVLFFISSTRHSCKSRLDGIYRYANKVGWRVQAIERAFYKVDVKEVMRFWTPDGVIAECGSGAGEFNKHSFGNVPVVYFDRDPKLCVNEMVVLSDSVEISKFAARELLSLKLDHYAYVPFRLPVYWNIERARVFVEEIKKSQKSCDIFNHNNIQNKEECILAIAEWLEKLPKPCGIFAANDYVSEDIVNACICKGLRIPNEIALLGVDNDEEICERTRPKLSSIMPDFEEAGYLAAKLLNSMMSSRKIKKTVHYFAASHIARRESTRFAGKLDRSIRTGTVAKAINYIYTEANKGISVNDIVRETRCSRRTLENRFRLETGKTILESLNNRLFEIACSLIMRNKPTVLVVAEMLSISRNTLDRIFLKRTGLTAFEWRKQHLTVT